MKGFIILIFSFLFVLQSCCMQQESISNTNAIKESGLTNTAVISSDTAIIIAKGYFCFDYDLRNYDVSVTEQSDAWKVQFIKRNLESEGGNPIIFIHKSNGERIYAIHGK